MTVDREKANQEALKRLTACDPVFVDVQRAIDVLPGMRPDMILTSGAPLPWSEIVGLQRRAVINGALYEGLAATVEEAAAKLDAGEILVEPTQRHGCVGTFTGIYTASMPVYVIENRAAGTRGYCNMVEGNPPRLFANGSWGDDVIERMRFIDEVAAPVLKDAVRRSGGIPLKPIMRRALAMGDELHIRHDAATHLFMTALVPTLLEVAREREEDVRRTIAFMEATPNMFLRLAVATAKSALEAAHGVEGSSMVTGMIFSCKDFAIRVSGLGDEWFRGPHPEFLGNFFWGSTHSDIGWAGGESTVMETIGLGGFAQAAALALPFRGSVEETVERNLRMYDITLGENLDLKIPYFDRGSPVGIDIFKVVETGVRPTIYGAVIRKDGDGAAGVGPMAAQMGCFKAAAEAYIRRYQS